MERRDLERDMCTFGTLVYRTAYLYAKNHHTAEDIYQDVFLKLFTSNVDFESEEHKKAWLLRVTSNHSINDLNRAWNRKKVGMDTVQEPVCLESTEEAVVASEQHGEVMKCLFQIKKQYREVIYFYYYMEMNIREIAELLHLSENTVKTRMRRGKIKLKEKLKGGYFSDEEIN